MMDVRLTLAILSWAALAGIAFWPAIRKEEPTEKQWRWAFVFFSLVLALLLPLWRWQSLIFEGELNLDEGSGIALGQKYLHDPIPWRSVDGITCGPLSTWVNLWPSLFGLALTYFTQRLTALALIFVTTTVSALTLKEVIGRRFGLLCVLPVVTLLATTLHDDFLTSALEYLPVAMAALAMHLMLGYHRTPGTLHAFLVGFITGAMPFSKLQCAPSAVLLWAVLAGLVIRQNGEAGKARWRHLLGLVIGGLTVPVLILVPVIVAGAWPEFMNFYISCGVSYGVPLSVPAAVEFLVSGNAEFSVYGMSLLFASVVLLWPLRKGAPDRGWMAGLGILLFYTGVLVYSVLRSGHDFPHYLILLIMPVALLTAWAVKARLLHPASADDPRRTLLIAAAFGIQTLVQGGYMARQYVHDTDLLRARPAENHPVVPVLLRYAKPGDSMAIWGWANKLHALTGIRPATRFIGTTYVTDPSPKYQRYRELFVEDIQRERPRLFVDAVDVNRWPTWPPGELARHDMLPDLADWVRSQYLLVASVQNPKGGLPVLVYLRKDP